MMAPQDTQHIGSILKLQGNDDAADDFNGSKG